jgi:Prenyltransferase and squalene oxidase repeat
MQRSSAAVALATGALLACLAGSASAEVTDDQARAAATEGAEWIQSQQAADGGLGAFGGDWAMIALANAGVHPADVRTSAADPSAQDFYFADWTGSFPLEGTSIYRGLLVGRAGGIPTAKLSASENLLAKTAGEFDGEQFGATALVNDDIFAVLGIERAGAISSISPRAAGFIREAQAPDGGWGFGAPGTTGDTDMTGAAIASLCAAGASPADADVAAGLDFLESVQNDTNGGFDSTFFGSNADSTAWAVDGLRACGIDPQGLRWTTSADKTPLDFLLTLQKANGAFQWMPGDDTDNLYSTQNGITALVGDGFGAAPPVRVNPADPVVRPAPAVPAGTQVPLTLVLDHDSATPGADRICSFAGAIDAPVAEVLAQAASTAAPAGCVSSLTVDSARVTSVNGVGEQPGSAVWTASLDEAPATASVTGQVQLGSVIALSLSPVPGGPAPEPQRPTPMPQGPEPDSVIAKASLKRRAGLTLGRGGRVRLPVGCPRGIAACQGTLAVKFRPAGPRGALRAAGRTTFTLAGGESAAVTVKLGRRLRARVAKSKRPQRVRIEAVVRDPATGTVGLTRVLATITKRR